MEAWWKLGGRAMPLVGSLVEGLVKLGGRACWKLVGSLAEGIVEPWRKECACLQCFGGSLAEGLVGSLLEAWQGGMCLPSLALHTCNCSVPPMLGFEVASLDHLGQK